MRKSIFYIIGLLVSVVFSDVNCTYTQETTPFYKEPVVRVALMKNVRDFMLRVRGRYEIVDLEHNQILRDDRVLDFSRVHIQDQAICIQTQCYPTLRLGIVPNQDFSLVIRGQEHRFRGRLDLYGNPDGSLLLVNRLGIEDYIKGVLPHEIPIRWPLESMMAQAVAVRTYALYQIKINSDKPYDVTRDIYSQVYGGRTSEHYRTNIAVERTRQEVLTYQNQILPAYFHSTCGGHTEDANELWEHANLKPLKGVVCRFCALSPHYHWKKEYRLKDIQDRLNQNKYPIGLIKEIEVLARNPSGRIQQLRITDRDGKQMVVSGKVFRNILGPNNLKSNNYRVVMKGYYVDFLGLGWGHGVGLCQWGTLGMARQGYDYQTILNYYYPGAVLIKL